MDSSSRQSGSIVSFVVIGLVLVGLLLGGLYLSKQRGRQVATGDQPATTQTVREGETQNEAGTGANEGNGTRETTAPPAPAPSPAPAPQSTGSTPTRPNTPQSTPNTGPTQIAETGPADSVVNGIVLFAISTATVSYVISRRDYIRSSLGSL